MRKIENNEVKEIFDNRQRISIKLEYDKVGREVLRKFGNGTSEQTLYDKAGRVTVKTQKNSRGELLWGEGYVYGSDGKRTATVDNLGRITFYEYNNKGQLSTVYYPYTEEMIRNLKSESETNGLTTTAEAGENRFITSTERAKLVPLLNSMQYGLAYNLTSLQIFIKESYAYDRNGNRTSKTTPYGKIEYTYDRENCLLSSGSKGQPFINYTYDRMGNLLTEESANKTVKYAYNSQNRLIYCEVTDRADKEYAQTTYAYDAFGRRVLVQDKNEAAIRTLYDGLTFDIIKQGPTFANGQFTDSGSGIKFSSTGRPTGDRYRYLGDEDKKDGSRYFYLDEGTYKNVSSRYRGERTTINVNGTLAAQTTTEGTDYFSTDLLGSIRSTTDVYGAQKSNYTYDAFGSLVQGDITSTTDFGYLGKQHDPTTKLYNYGYRDYKPQTARFTTLDPIRDGHNWFSYCNSDPVNFIDIFGLCEVNDNVKLYVYRDKNSYNISNIRGEPKNVKLDTLVLYNTKTGQYKSFKGVQTVANYPNTDPAGNKVDSCFMDTLGTCNFTMKVYDKTNVAGGTAAVITDGSTIDGRKIDKNGYTQKPKSEGRGMVHSNERPDGTGKTYDIPYSKQCIIMTKEDNEDFFETLKEWGVKDNEGIKGTVYDIDRRDR